MSWYEIKALSEKKIELFIYDIIGKDFWGDGSTVEAKKLISEVKAAGEIDEIVLRINSNGGSVFEGNAIYNFLEGHKAKKTVYIDSLAASMASVLAMLGEVHMPKNAMMMIHDPLMLIYGNSAEMEKAIDLLEKIKLGIVSAYENKTGLDRETISEMMTTETWMTADEAKALGFADFVSAPVKMAAAFDLSPFKNVPEGLFTPQEKVETVTKAEEPTIQNEEEGELSMEITLEMIKKEHADITASLLKEGAEAERQRIKDIEDLLVPGQESLVNELKFDGVTSAPEAAVKILKAEQEAKQKVLAQIKEETPKPVSPSVENKDTVVSDDLPAEERCKLAWDKSPDLRKEFGSYEDYLAYEKACNNGQVKILGQKAS